MISKNVDFYESSPSLGLQVSRTDSGARITYGKILDSFYTETFETPSIKKIEGEAQENSFLDPIDFDKNLVPFSFEYDKVLVLTCSLAFLGSVSENGQVAPPPIPSFFEGISDCFFQEKKKEDISSAYITDSQEFIFLKNKEEPVYPIGQEPPPDCPTLACPIYYCNIDVPIYTNGIQLMEGSLSFSLVGVYEETSKFVTFEAGCPEISRKEGTRCPCPEPLEEAIKCVAYIKVEGG
jgi:hypothetical protein